jgi:hypothetical protein
VYDVPVNPGTEREFVAVIVVVIFDGSEVGQYFTLYPDDGAGDGAGKVKLKVAIMN